MNSSNKIFKEIALSLSGGGYRAAAFHLGTLEILNRLELLSDITVLSTVSGGTITGVTYAAAMAEGLSFDEFRQKLYQFLRDRNVITTALSDLEKSVQINGAESMPSLIRAAANVYAADELLGNKTLDFLLSDEKSTLKELAFNATEFRTGNSFRFQKSQSPQVRSGNNDAKIKPQISKLIRLADIVAASSCFPSGFEPLRFPSDFVWADLQTVKDDLGERFSNDLPLMDGGIFDNQGIDSIANIYKRKKDEIGLFIVSDTSQRQNDLFQFPPKKKSGWLSLRILYALMIFLLIGSIFTTLTIVEEFISSVKGDQLNLTRGIFLYLIPFIFSLGVALAIAFGRFHAIRLQKILMEKTGIELWKYAKHLTVPEIIELVDSRLKSLIILTSSVFMKRIRALGFTRIFADTDLHEKVLPNLIYDLDNQELWGEEITNRNLQPSENLRKVSRRAESYATNLWFLDSQELDNLIVCGQATMCFKILKYLLNKKSDEIKNPDSPESQLFEKAREIWLEINK